HGQLAGRRRGGNYAKKRPPITGAVIEPGGVPRSRGTIPWAQGARGGERKAIGRGEVESCVSNGLPSPILPVCGSLRLGTLSPASSHGDNLAALSGVVSGSADRPVPPGNAGAGAARGDPALDRTAGRPERLADAVV